jgi:predicted ABC-type ATPase
VSEPDPGRYLLPEAENRRIFAERIVPHLLTGRAPQEIPTVVFLIGQPGAGKSRISAVIGDQLDRRGGFVDIDTDLYKPYHPEYDRLLAQDDTLMALHTGPDGRAWMARAHEYVRAQHINALIQEISDSPESVAHVMRQYCAAGFQVEVMIMAVSKPLSDQGIINRYHEQVRERGHGRLTVQAKADQSYAGILELADLVDQEQLADVVGVFRRGQGLPRYANSLDARRQWVAPARLRAAIADERVRPWTPEESADYRRTQQKLRRELGTEWAARLDEIERGAKALLSPSDREPTPEPRPGAQDFWRFRKTAPQVISDAREQVSTADADGTPNRHDHIQQHGYEP